MSTTQPTEEKSTTAQQQVEKKKKTKKKKTEKPKKQPQKKKVTKLSLQDFLAESDTTTETKAWGERDDEFDFALDPSMREPYLTEKKEEPKPEEKKEERQPKPIDESRIPKDGPYVAYIGNLPYSVKEQDIEGFFSDCQIKDISLPMDRNRGTIKGFGYVEFKNVDSLKNALKNDGMELLGRRIRVDISDKPKREPKERGPRKERRQRSAFDDFEHEKRETKSDAIENWRVKPADYVPPKPRTERLEKERYAKKNDRFRQRDHFSHHKYQKDEGPITKKEEKKEPPKPVIPRENPFGEGKPWEPTELAKKIEERLEKQKERLARRREERREDKRKQKEERKSYALSDVPSRSAFGTQRKEGKPERGRGYGRGYSRTFKNQQQEERRPTEGKEKAKEKPKVVEPKEEKKKELTNLYDVLDEVQA